MVTDEPGHYVEPAFSPDGRSVVYRKATRRLPDARRGRPDPASTACRPTAAGKPSADRHDGRAAAVRRGLATRVLLHVESEDGGRPVTRKLVRIDLDGARARTHLTTASSLSEFARLARRPVARVPASASTPTSRRSSRPARRVDIGPKSKALPVRAVSTRRRRVPPLVRAIARGCTGRSGPSSSRATLKDAFAFVPARPKKLPEPPAHGVDVGFTAADSTRRPARSRSPARRIVTMKGDEVIEDGTIVVEGNRIAAVGPARAACRCPRRRAVDRRRGQDHHARHRRRALARRHGRRTASCPQQNWVNYAVARVRRDDDPRPVERHGRDLRRGRDGSARA